MYRRDLVRLNVSKWSVEHKFTTNYSTLELKGHCCKTYRINPVQVRLYYELLLIRLV